MRSSIETSTDGEERRETSVSRELEEPEETEYHLSS